MKVIDLLNKIANDEEVPETIYYSGLEFEWTGLNYYCKKTDEYLDKHICLEDLEQEVEIIEEPQEHKIPKKITSIYIIGNNEVLADAVNEFQSKINEIIDYLEVNNDGKR